LTKAALFGTKQYWTYVDSEVQKEGYGLIKG